MAEELEIFNDATIGALYGLATAESFAAPYVREKMNGTWGVIAVAQALAESERSKRDWSIYIGELVGLLGRRGRFGIGDAIRPRIRARLEWWDRQDQASLRSMLTRQIFQVTMELHDTGGTDPDALALVFGLPICLHVMPMDDLDQSWSQNWFSSIAYAVQPHILTKTLAILYGELVRQAQGVGIKWTVPGERRSDKSTLSKTLTYWVNHLWSPEFLSDQEQNEYQQLLDRLRPYKDIDYWTSADLSQSRQTSLMLDIFEVALWSFFKFDTFKAGLDAAEAATTDPAATCAVYGALAGSYYGSRELPHAGGYGPCVALDGAVGTIRSKREDVVESWSTF